MTTLIVSPLPVAAIAASRGSGVENLNSYDPKEVWADGEAGSGSTLLVDLGSVQEIDTVALIAARAGADATWAIDAGETGYGQFRILQPGLLRVANAVGRTPAISAALWHGAPVEARYLTIYLLQPTGDRLTIGRLIVGRAFAPELGKEWGSGRRPIDTGTATGIVSGGFATVEGVRKRYFSWTFGDLGEDETDRLEAIALDHGETIPVLLVDEPDRPAGLFARILYARFDRWKAYERRNRAQTRWELGAEEWV